MNNIDIETLLDGTATIETKIEILNSRGEVETTLTNEDSVKTWELSDLRYVPDAGFLGKFVERNLEGTLQNISENFNIENREIVLYLGMRRYVDSYTDADLEVTGNAHSIIHGVDSKLGSYITTFYSLGNFIVDKPSDDEVKDNTRYTAKDYTIKFNIAFNGDYTSVEFPKSFNTLLNENGSVTAEWLARYTCNQAGVELGSTDFVNNNFRIPSNQFDSGDQCRDVMKYIGKLAYSWVRVDWDNKVYIDFKVKKTVDLEYNNITKDDYYRLETQKETYGAINKVALGSSIVEGLYSYVEDSASIATNGEKVLVINDNPILYTDELRNEAVKTGNVLFGLTYTPIVTETTGHPWLKGNELISIVTSDDSVIYSYPFDRILKYNGHIKTEIASYASTKVEEDYNYTGTGTTSNQFKYTRVLLDRNTQMLTSYMEKTDNNSSQISSVEQNLEGAVVRVTNVEKGLSTTNTNLETTNKNVINLQTQINGVSADFEDFKDNEYVQSINNLQSQIDGAIQFWNGADIPTLNNYPAINWKTEADRVNHQADIYTVIEDVEGELKQGKAYRFDKVDGVWQWIELTDNELSAVQALAQEALNKANTNTSDIKVLKQTDTEIKADINGINLKYDTLNNDYQANLTTRKSVSGNPTYISDSGGYALEKDFIYGMSIQEIRSGKNLFEPLNTETKYGITLTKNSDGSMNVVGTSTYETELVFLYYKDIDTSGFENGKKYTISTNQSLPSGMNVRVEVYNDGAWKRLFLSTSLSQTNTADFTGGNRLRFALAVSAGATININNLIIQVEAGSTASEIESYGASPSPDYPSEIINNRGIENLINNYGFVKGRLDNGVLGYESNTTSLVVNDNEITFITDVNYRGITSEYIEVEENTTYVLNSNVDTNTVGRGVHCFDKDYKYISSASHKYISNNITLHTTPTKTKYIRVCLLMNTMGKVTINDLQLEKGSIAHSFVPFGSNYLVQKICGKNLFNELLTTNVSINGSGVVGSNTAFTTTDYLPAKETTYYFKTTPIENQTTNQIYIAFYNKNREFLSRPSANAYENSYTAPIGTAYMRAGYYNTGVKEPMLIESSTASKYEPYKETIITYDLQGNELCEIKNHDIKDNVEFVSGKMTKQIDKYVFNGTEGWTPNTPWNTSYPNIFHAYTYLKNTSKNGIAISENLPVSGGLGNECIFKEKSQAVYIFIRADRLSSYDVAGLKEYLANNPITMYHELAEPQTIQLEPTEIKLYEGINNIYTESNVNVEEVDIVYLTDSVLNSQYATKSEVKIAEGRIEANVSNTTTILQNEIDETNNSLATTDARVDSTATDLQNQLNDTNKKFNNYASTATVTTIQNSVTGIQTSLNAQIAITKDIQENGVSKVKTSTNYTFDEDGLNIEKSDESNKSTIDNNGIEVTRDNGSTRTFFAGYDEETGSSLVDADNMTVDDHLIMMNHVRVEEYTDSSTSKTGVGFFWIG